jgi:DNA-binding transcriptional LysR family regulator
MNYTLNQLQIYIKIVKTMSITKAAEELHLTQPAVSIQLKNFQDQFDIPLTEIIGRKIYVTEFGHEIAQAAEQIIDQVYAINYKTMAYKGILTGKLRISIVSTGKYIMPFFLADFINQNSGVDLYMDVTNKSAVIESLEKNEVDFALVSIIPNSLYIEKIDLLPNKLYLVGKHLPKSIKGINSNEVFKELPFIFREKGSGTRQTMEKFIAQKNISVLKKMELTSNEAIKQALLAGFGYSIMPLITKGLPIKTTWSLIWLKGKKHNPSSLAFLNYLKKEKNNIIDANFSWYEKY